jgi:hypothetical protein
MACPILFRLENPTSRSDTVGDGAGEICHEAGTVTFLPKGDIGPRSSRTTTYRTSRTMLRAACREDRSLRAAP